MARAWLIDSRGIARKVKHATQFSASQIKENGANRECPNCHHRIDNSDVSLEWPGLPAGVKFDPSDVELLEHLAGKVGLGNSEPHLFIDEFILTLEGDKGICYTHPENLPGAKKDGSSVHFFHRTANAYATGHRKCRKIQNQPSLTEEHVRWHKTGKTKPVIENRIHKGWQKIMVLYKSSKKGCKPEKLNWVMFQYHLGQKENEKEGEYVVSKIFYQQQQKQKDKSDVNLASGDPDKVKVEASPKTPKTNTPNLHRPGKRPLFDEDDEENESEFIQEVSHSPQPAIRLDDEKVDTAWLAGQSQAVMDPDPNGVDDSLLCNEILDSYAPMESEFIQEVPQHPLPAIRLDDDKVETSWLAGESQAVIDPDLNGVDDSLLCNEILDSYAPFDNPGLRNAPYYVDFNGSQMDAVEGYVSTANGIPDLDGIDLGTPPDFELADLQFGSQESIMSWLDRL